MKHIKLLILILLFSKIASAYTITKTASVTNAYLGDSITYTITVCGITNLNQLVSITDNLNPSLTYLGNNLSSVPFMGAYSVCGCSGVPTTAFSSGVFSVNFPSCTCALTSSSCFSFQIYTKVNENACSQKGSPVSNTTTLNTTAGSITSAPSSVNILTGVPWNLSKTFQSYLFGFLNYDIRLNAAHGGYSSQVLFNAGSGAPMFKDTFDFGTCVTLDPLASQLLYYDPSTSSYVIHSATFTIISTTKIEITWSLPPGITLNSYQFLLKIKTTGCTCSPSTFFNINNKVNFNGEDQCGEVVNLNSNANITPVYCSGGSLSVPSKNKACISKQVFLNGNNLNLTMPGCTGRYVITISNCSNYLKYTNINFTDVLDPNLILGTAIVSPVSYTSILSTTGSTVTFSGPVSVPIGGTITITIPFTVSATTPPNTCIKNCIPTIDFGANNLITSAPMLFTETTICDAGFCTVPLVVTTFLEKKVCNAISHSCPGGLAPNTNFLPGDNVEYMLHFYNFGTLTGTNLILKDILPNYLSVLNPATDIKIFKTNSDTWINGTCDELLMGTPLSIPKIAGTTAPIPNQCVYNNSTRELAINFGGNILNGFTCTGITHYFIKVNAKIALTAPNNIYTNSFKIDYTTPSPTTAHTDYSNNADVVVSKDNLIVFSKSQIGHVQDCDKETDTVEYKIVVANLGSVQVMYNINDVITIPAGITLAKGIFNLKTCDVPISGLPGTPLPPVAPYIASHITYLPPVNPSAFNVVNILLDPCHARVITYKVVFSTAGIPLGADGPPICNAINIQAGFSEPIVFGSGDHGGSKIKNEKPNLILASNALLVNKYFNATTDIEKLKVLEEIKLDCKKEEINNPSNLKTIGTSIPIPFPKSDPSNGLTFTTISTGNTSVCYTISPCPSGIQNGCINTTDGNGVLFKINGVDLTGKVKTTTTITSLKKIKKIEYVLSDIRMVQTCPTSPPWKVALCSPCSGNLVGLVSAIAPLPTTGVGLLTLNPPSTIPSLPSGAYNEMNRTEFVNSIPLNLTGTSSIVNFQLPISTLNCGGRLEFVITALITYEDCTVCYVSDAYKQNCAYQIIWYPDLNINIYDTGVDTGRPVNIDKK